MLKDALLPLDEVKDNLGFEFTVLAAAPNEAVLELSPEAHAEDPLMMQFSVVERNEQGVWIFRDDPSVYLVDQL
jgi:hypothetical protein